MAQIVLISITSQDTQNSGDFISKHDDKTPLDGPGYSDFTVVKIPSLELSDIVSIESGDNFSAMTISNIDTLYKASKSTALTMLESLRTVE